MTIIQIVNKTIHRFSAVICISVLLITPLPSLLLLDFPFFSPPPPPRVRAFMTHRPALNEVRPRPLLINSQAGR